MGRHRYYCELCAKPIFTKNLPKRQNKISLSAMPTDTFYTFCDTEKICYLCHTMSQTIHEILQRYWGYDTFRPLQEEIIHSVLAGRDTLALMPTGGGKSITYQVPGMYLDGTCIVVTPLIALMKDQVDTLRALDIKAAYLHSGMSRREMLVALENCILGKYKFLYVSPERLSTELFLDKIRDLQVSLLVVDEAHCISQWGYDFRPNYLRIADLRAQLPDVPVLAVTATATPEVTRDIQEKLLFCEENVFRKSFHRANLRYVVRHNEDKMQQLIYILSRVPGSAIVYVRSRKRTKEVAEDLRRAGVSALFYHAGIDSEEKNERQQQWKEGRARVMVATNAFGMGIDKADVRLVVHMDLPSSPEEYYQEAGRAGRDGKTAYAVMLYSTTDKAKLHKRVTDMFPEREFIIRIYEALCNYLQIAEGFGLDTRRDFDLNLFCQTFKFPTLPTFHALKILEQSGYIEYIEEPDSQSRIMVTVQRDELYRLHVGDSKVDEVLQCLLRSYTGLFADYVYIRESILERRTGLSQEDIYEALIFLSKQHIVHYIPQKRMPMICFTRSREQLRYVEIPRSVYEVRKEKFAYRIERTLQYATVDNACRVRLLLDYFGENTSCDCGACDYCLQKKDEGLSPMRFDKITASVRELLTQSPCTLQEMIARLPYPEAQVLQTLRYLTDERYITLTAGTYTLKK